MPVYGMPRDFSKTSKKFQGPLQLLMNCLKWKSKLSSFLLRISFAIIIMASGWSYIWQAISNRNLKHEVLLNI